MIDRSAGDHKSWVESSSSDTAKRVPCSVIKPVPEVVESIGD